MRGVVSLATGEGVGYAASFVRTMILARVLSKGDFGIAAVITLIMALLELSAKLGLTQFIVRDEEGDTSALIASAHFVNGMAAIVSALLIIVSADFIAPVLTLGGQPSTVTLLALAALLRGFEHLDVRRYERDLRFLPSSLTDVIPQVVITIVAWPAATALGDYRVVPVLLVVKAAIGCVVSHILSEMPYRWRVCRQHLTRIATFSWPLVINGFMLWVILQGDQFLIASNYDPADLGPFAAAAALTVGPTFLFAKVFNSVALPILAAVQTDTLLFFRRFSDIMNVITAVATSLGVVMILGGEALMRLVYGSKYAGAGMLLAWLSAANAFRTLRIAPALAATARGDSRNHMLSNIWRAGALLPAAIVAHFHGPLHWIAATGILGEAVACAVCVFRLRRRDGITLSQNVQQIVIMLSCLFGAGMAVAFGVHHLSMVPTLVLAIATGSISLSLLIASAPRLRNEVARLRVVWRRLPYRTAQAEVGAR